MDVDIPVIAVDAAVINLANSGIVTGGSYVSKGPLKKYSLLAYDNTGKARFEFAVPFTNDPTNAFVIRLTDIPNQLIQAILATLSIDSPSPMHISWVSGTIQNDGVVEAKYSQHFILLRGKNR